MTGLPFRTVLQVGIRTAQSCTYRFTSHALPEVSGL